MLFPAEYRPGEHLINEGEASDHIVILYSGHTRVMKSQHDNRADKGKLSWEKD